ncbi:NAD(P)/FAD-dependent oxidoreductase [Amycolatopsis sp. cg5]|uniref:NAD(P)/FAD-dependent oxidoreductase n=1 Tax=Amycolatopsis sp. cg5 TaxID=3238802 RepID=UPI003524F1BE
MYDVIVVGARCAGSITALLFARNGYRVLLLDRARFPRDTLSTHYLHQPAIAKLRDWGLLDAITATGCPPLDQAVYQVGSLRVEGCSEPVDGIEAAYAPRRHLLDEILVRAAVEAGAELREGTSVEALLTENDRVTGVRCGGHDERAQLVVGADGMRSTVADLVKAPLTVEDPTLSCVYYAYWLDLPAKFEVYEAEGSAAGTIPTNDGATLVATYFPQADFDRVRADAETAYLENIRRTSPELFERVSAGRRVERLRGTGDQRNYFRQAAGPGWVLVGDAGHHKDSITARGISDAFTQAELLVTAIGEDLYDDGETRRALEWFGKQRDRLLAEIYQTTLVTARLSVDHERVELLRELTATPAGARRYFSTVAGVCSVNELYALERAS